MSEVKAGKSCGKQRRTRKITHLAMEWLIQRLKKSEDIKEKLADGSYRVDSTKVAASIVNED